jgi:hypothetical protein
MMFICCGLSFRSAFLFETPKIVIPPRAGHFSTLRLLASLQRRNSRLALKQSSLRVLRCGGSGRKKNLQCALPESGFQESL